MLKRKVVSAILTLFLSTFVFTVFLPLDSFFTQPVNQDVDLKEDLISYTLFFSLGLLLYGLPISILIEKITSELPQGRLAFSFILYVFFGFLPFFFLWIFTIYSLSISIMFFLIDESIRRFRQEKDRIINNVY